MNKVKALIESGHEAKFLELVEKIESKVVLNPELQKMLDEKGNTPIAEPELVKAMNQDRITFLKKLLTNEEINKYSAQEVGDFIYAAEQQITQMTLEDGSYKSTPNTENCQLPNFLEADELMKLGENEREARMELGNNPSDKKILTKVNAASKKMETRTFAISGLDIKKLTDWEKNLVKTQVYMSAINASLSAVGRSLGNL